MFRKTALMAIAATAALGAAMLTTVTAEAGPGPGKPGILKPGVIGGVKPMPIKPIGIKPMPIKPKWPPHVKPKWPKPHVHVHVHRRVIYAAPAVYAVARPVVSRPGPCTCLTKEYTQEGAVLFKDRCTNEIAMNPPPAPQQTGMVEQQSQTAYVQQPQMQPQGNAAAK
jgi:hypothetical protein